jgi:hypothetical protein
VVRAGFPEPGVVFVVGEFPASVEGWAIPDIAVAHVDCENPL